MPACALLQTRASVGVTINGQAAVGSPFTIRFGAIRTFCRSSALMRARSFALLVLLRAARYVQPKSALVLVLFVVRTLSRLA